MSVAKNEVAELNRVISALQKVVAQLNKPGNGATAKTATKRARRTRRSGKELIAFRKMLISERKKGVPVAKLAKQHGISTAYIYQL